MPKPAIQGVYAIVDHPEPVQRLLEGGARIVQLRMKNQPAEAVAEAARSISRLKTSYDFIFLINDHLDLARELHADGYHGGKDDPPIDAARKILGPNKLIGYSSHSLEEAVEAEQAGADYVAFGAIFRSPSKEASPSSRPPPTRGGGFMETRRYYAIQGVDKLREVVSKLSVPVVAIGGIGRDNIKEVLATGVSSVAMISALLRSPDVLNETKFYAGLFG